MSTDLTHLTAKEVTQQVKKILEDKGCTEVASTEGENGSLVVFTFNCKELTSFNQHIAGWTYSGTQLDPTGKRQYKLDFLKTS